MGAQGGDVQGSGKPAITPAQMRVWRQLALWMSIGPLMAGFIFIIVYFGIRSPADLSSYVQTHGVQ